MDATTLLKTDFSVPVLYLDYKNAQGGDRDEIDLKRVSGGGQKKVGDQDCVWWKSSSKFKGNPSLTIVCKRTRVPNLSHERPLPVDNASSTAANSSPASA